MRIIDFDQKVDFWGESGTCKESKITKTTQTQDYQIEQNTHQTVKKESMIKNLTLKSWGQPGPEAT